MKTQPLPDAADAGCLTHALRRAGLLGGGGRVRDVTIGRTIAKQRSLTLRLMLAYEGVADEAPRSLILKSGHLDGAGRPAYDNAREIAFYRTIAPAMAEPVTPRCFEACDATQAAPWHLLLEDLTDTHVVATEHPLPPTPDQCARIVRAWARFHAAWWDDPRLGLSVGRWPAEGWDLTLRHATGRLARFIDRFGQVLSPARRALYERLLDRAPSLLARYRARRDVTLGHGDAHPWNCVLPRAAGDDDVRLFDWESWSVETGATDIASMMAMLWYPDMRRQLERPLLDLYHAELVTRGVRGYDRRALHDDYRLAVLLLILRPIGQAAIDIPPRVWWPNLERIMLAVDDLGCRDLLA